MWREFRKRARHFLLGDQFINSHNLISWQSMDMVRRKLMLVTIRILRVNGIFGGTLDLAFNLEFLCVLKVVLMADS